MAQLTPLEQAKLRMYRGMFPNIQSSTQALEKACAFEELARQQNHGDLFQEMESIFRMAALLEKEEQPQHV